MNIEPRRVFTDPRYFLALGFGAGLSPRAPGTVGSVVALPFVFLLMETGTVGYAVLTLGAFAGGVWLCDVVARDLGAADPAPIVFDEFVGLWVALFLLPDGWIWLLAGFVLFRLFDILKPWPVSWLDKNVKGGLGIMLDDVAAGLYALLTIQFIAWFLARFL